MKSLLPTVHRKGRVSWPLRNQACSNILKVLPAKKWKFSDKNCDIFHTSAQNINCGYSLEPLRPGSCNEYSQSMFLSRNKNNNVHPSKPQFYYIKWSLRGSTLHRRVFVMCDSSWVCSLVVLQLLRYRRHIISCCNYPLNTSFKGKH